MQLDCVEGGGGGELGMASNQSGCSECALPAREFGSWGSARIAGKVAVFSMIWPLSLMNMPYQQAYRSCMTTIHTVRTDH